MHETHLRHSKTYFQNIYESPHIDIFTNESLRKSISIPERLIDGQLLKFKYIP
ncbi:hypothetical protein SK128_007706, partial [Halocaridina rubra]